jgi:hypothetical protein
MKRKEQIIEVFFFTGVGIHSELLRTLSKVTIPLLLALFPAL